MLRFRTLAAAAVGASGALVAGTLSPAGAAGAAGDPAIGTQVLNMLCASKAGSPFFTPMTISRCQDARPQTGLRSRGADLRRPPARQLRERDQRQSSQQVNWFCFHGPAAP